MGDELPSPEVMMRRYRRLVTAVAARVMGTHRDAEDVAQDVFLAATRALPHLRDPGALQGWLTRTAFRIALRRAGQRRRRQDVEALALSWLGQQLSPEEIAQIGEAYQIARGLPAQGGELWRLHYVEGCTHDELTARTGVAGSVLKRRLAHARRAIQDA